MPAVDDFLKTVLRSGLLDREQLQQTLRAVPREQRDSPEALATHLIKSGKLSRFQARKLLQGTALGLVLGPFQVLAPIGKGGMGTVYLSRDSRSGQLIALKVLPPKRAREEERVLARFRREMEMCQRVAHPHLAWTYEVGVCQGVYYIAMEYIPGKSLYRLVASEGPLRMTRAARLFAEVASALEHAHVQGLIHRDLKPSNIMITPHDHAKLLDLGLALMQGEKGADREVIGGQGYVVGTMDYIAPEQADDASKADARSDLYALGCTLYHALTGRPPFPGGTPMEKIQRHHDEEPAPIPPLNPDVAPAFIGLVRRLMAKKPSQRPASAAEVCEALLGWAAGEEPLPLDQPDDLSYREAVELIESAEPPSELSGEVIPLPAGDAVVVAEPFVMPSVATPAPLKKPSVPPVRPGWVPLISESGLFALYALAGGLGVLGLGAMGLAMFLLARH